MKALITGASSDVTKALAEKLLNEGHEVILTCSSEDSLSMNSQLWKDKKVSLIKMNLSSVTDSKKELEELNIDLLILNAWEKVDELKMFHKFDYDEIESEFKTNVRGNTELLQVLLPGMIERNLGRILFISTMATISGTSRYAPYAMSKAAIEALIRNIAVDYGNYNITANTLRPGILKTERTKRFWKRDFYVKKVTAAIPLQKMGDPLDVANAAMPFLQENTYITGTELNVSGGLPLFNSSLIAKQKS